ncbi:hypothetical protein KGP36_02030 [Patescibacteria group bacterium]|nr:hypothetical protein [Patescibacteria group bacterium]
MTLPKHIHVIGICGVAMSALAIAFHKRGVKVTGSDKGFFPPVSTELEKHSIPFYAGWHPEKMSDPAEGGLPDLVIVGTASGTHNPEALLAKEKGILALSYPEAIGRYFARKESIVCCGTWGKTSSAAMLSFIMTEAGFDPSYMFGGVSLSHEASAKLTDSGLSIFEGDEYKSSPTDPRAKFFHYKPTRVLLSAVSWDHADLYPTEAAYFEAFKKLMAILPEDGSVIACADNEGAMKIVSAYGGKKISYGRARPTPTLDYEYKDVSQSRDGLKLTIVHGGKAFKIKSPMLGLYQAENICGCFAMASELGAAPDRIADALTRFKGLKRRLEKRLDERDTGRNVAVIDDIAHSPEKAASVLHALKSIYPGRVIAVFEPNTGGRRREAIAKYDGAFASADEVVIPKLTKLKMAENEADRPIEGQELAGIIKKTHANASYIEDDQELVEHLVENAKSGDVIAFLGSHGFRGMIEESIKSIKS